LSRFKWVYIKDTKCMNEIRVGTLYIRIHGLCSPWVLLGWEGSWSDGSWIYNYLCNQCLSPLKGMSSNPTYGEVYSIQHYVINVCQLLATGRWFSPGTLVSSTNKTGHHDITEILLKVALNTITLNFFFEWTIDVLDHV
jgi:hypothetical protein